MPPELTEAPKPTAQRFLSIKEAAHRVGISDKMIQQMLYRHDDPLPSVKLGRRRLIDIETLDAFVLRHAA